MVLGSVLWHTLQLLHLYPTILGLEQRSAYLISLYSCCPKVKSIKTTPFKVLENNFISGQRKLQLPVTSNSMDESILTLLKDWSCPGHHEVKCVNIKKVCQSFNVIFTDCKFIYSERVITMYKQFFVNNL